MRSAHHAYAYACAAVGAIALGLGGCHLERRIPSAPLLAAADSVPMPGGPLGEAIRRGRAIANATRDSAPDHVGNKLRCTSCHLDDARRLDAAPWIGITARFPQYRSRAGHVISLEDRINACFERSLNGRALAPDDARLRALMAYMAWLSTGVRVGDSVPGSGFVRLEPTVPNRGSGKTLFATQCARCHGAAGEGGVAPPVWGPESYNIGAGMARLSIAAAFVYRNMPHDRAAALTVQDAFDVAAYVNAQPRPDYVKKADDWPNGDPPKDVAYPTRAGRRPGS